MATALSYLSDSEEEGEKHRNTTVAKKASATESAVAHSPPQHQAVWRGDLGVFFTRLPSELVSRIVSLLIPELHGKIEDFTSHALVKLSSTNRAWRRLVKAEVQLAYMLRPFHLLIDNAGMEFERGSTWYALGLVDSNGDHPKSPHLTEILPRIRTLHIDIEVDCSSLVTLRWVATDFHDCTSYVALLAHMIYANLVPEILYIHVIATSTSWNTQLFQIWDGRPPLNLHEYGRLYTAWPRTRHLLLRSDMDLFSARMRAGLANPGNVVVNMTQRLYAVLQPVFVQFSLLARHKQRSRSEPTDSRVRRAYVLLDNLIMMDCFPRSWGAASDFCTTMDNLNQGRNGIRLGYRHRFGWTRHVRFGDPACYWKLRMVD